MQRLKHRRIEGFSRRAKYILISLDGNETLVLHLGMSGRLLFGSEEQGIHEHLTFAFDNGTVLRFVDPRRFGMLDLCKTSELNVHRWFRHLGLEPLSGEFSGAALRTALSGRNLALKTALMNQTIIVGVGNIYASEALYLARLSPQRMTGSLSRSRAEKLAEAIRHVLLKAIDAGGSSLRDYVQASGELGNFQSQFAVYARAGQPCLQCGRKIKKIVQGSRATYYCSFCQR